MTVFVVPLFQAMWREGEVGHKNKSAVQTIYIQPEDENNKHIKNYWSHLLHLLAGLLPVVSNILILFLNILKLQPKTIRLFYKNSPSIRQHYKKYHRLEVFQIRN